MSSASLQLGGDNWAAKDGNLLGYQRSASSSVHIPHEFTFTRGSNLAATRVAANGLIEKGRENLLLQSNQFDTTWTISEGTILGGQSGYDGSSDAWLYTDNVGTTSKSHDVRQSVSESGVNCFSIYAKMGTKAWVKMYDGLNTCFFNIDPNYVGNRVGTDATSGGRVEDVGNGWFRLSVFDNGSTSLVLFGIAGSDGSGNYTSDGIGTVYIQDAQLEQGLVATDYIETGATTVQAGLLEDEPRIDYTGGTGSLLLEPSRTNLVSNNEYLEGNAEFSILSSSVTFADYTETSPDGNENALRVLEAEGSGGHNWYYSNLGGVTNGTTYCISFFAKSIKGRNISINEGGVGMDVQGIIDLSDGSILADVHNNISVEPYGNGWYRISAVGAMNGTSQRIIFYSVDGTSTSFEGNTTSGVSLWGVQLEEGSYPTSYIPNHSGGSVTRDADSSNITSGLSIGNGSEFGLYYEIDVDAIPRNSSSPFIQIQFATANGGVGIKGASDAIANYIDLYGTTDFSKYFSSRSMGNGIIKFFINYSSGTGDFYLNGTKYNGAISGPTSGCEIDSVYLLGSAYKLKAKQILIFPTALSDAQCITRTTL